MSEWLTGLSASGLTLFHQARQTRANRQPSTAQARPTGTNRQQEAALYIVDIHKHAGFRRYVELSHEVQQPQDTNECLYELACMLVAIEKLICDKNIPADRVFFNDTLFFTEERYVRTMLDILRKGIIGKREDNTETHIQFPKLYEAYKACGNKKSETDFLTKNCEKVEVMYVAGVNSQIKAHSLSKSPLSTDITGNSAHPNPSNNTSPQTFDTVIAPPEVNVSSSNGETSPSPASS